MAVAISTDPRSEFHQCRHIEKFKAARIYKVQIVHEAGVEFRNRFDQDVRIVEPHLDFIDHGWSGPADFIGLPEKYDLACDLSLNLRRMRLRERQNIESFQQSSDALPG